MLLTSELMASTTRHRKSDILPRGTIPWRNSKADPFVAERISSYCLAQEYFDCFGPELIFSTNENISCHSVRVTSSGNYKKARKRSFTLFRAGLSSRTYLSCFPLLVSPLVSSKTSQPIWQSTYSLSLSLCFLAAGRTGQHEKPHSLFFTDSSSLILSHIFRTVR